jgi:hypothetical protein
MGEWFAFVKGAGRVEITKDRIVRRPAESFVRDQLVVDPKDRALIERELSELEIRTRSEVGDDALGLVVFDLEGLERGLDLVKGATRTELLEEMAKEGARTYPGQEISPLDELLSYLRRRIASEHHGWYPSLAKNRMCENIEGSPYQGGSFGIPETAAPFTLPPQTRAPGRRIRIGVFDTPLYPHEAFAGRYYAATSGLLPPDTGLVTFGAHGLFVCSIAAMRARDAEFVIKPVLDPRTLYTTAWELATAMVASLKDDLDIMLLALGGTTADGQEPLILRRACERTAGVVKVAALGNHGDGPRPEGAPPRSRYTPPPDTPMWPAASSTVIAVGADVAEGGEAAYFSPTLEQAPWADVMAPGVRKTGLFLPGRVNVVRRDDEKGLIVDTGVSQDFGKGYATWDGSSFAAAEVAGVIARMAATEVGPALGQPGAATEAARLLLKDLSSKAADDGIRVVRDI